MRPLTVAMISVSTLAASVAMAGCGSSGNSAPVVYGTQPQSTGASRIYNSPNDYNAKNAAYNRSAGGRIAQSAHLATRQAMPPKIDNAYIRPAPLVPVTQTPYERPPVATSGPVYIAAQQPLSAPPSASQGKSGGPSPFVTVEPGDTVYGIGRRTGASPQAIIALNRLKQPYTLEIGDRLRVPRSTRVQAAQTVTPAPVSHVVARDIMHSVQPGETLYALSRATGASIQAIAQANQLRQPYRLHVGQQLLIPGARTGVAAQGGALSAPAVSNDGVARLAREVSYTEPALPLAPEPGKFFEWPVKGAIIGRYGAGELGKRNDGINIAAPVGTPVRAAAAGEVVYRGSELDGYGNLLLIKHDDGYVTAYAHNDVMLVRKGQKVNQGQVVAKVGQSGSASEPQLHFEIRQNLKSIDPLAFLGS